MKTKKLKELLGEEFGKILAEPFNQINSLFVYSPKVENGWNVSVFTHNREDPQAICVFSDIIEPEKPEVKRIEGNPQTSYRSLWEILNVILVSAKEPATKTRIMYSAYMSYSQVEWYLAYAISHGMLEQREYTVEELDELPSLSTGKAAFENKLIFVTTRRGLEFISKYEEIKTLFEIKNELRQYPKVKQNPEILNERFD